MKKVKCKLKRVGAFLIILLLCFNNFAAIVSDNDGSAFVTKAEFEALKENFAEQIDSYETSIDSKIDGAIAAYLDGLRFKKTIKVPNYIKDYLTHYGLTRVVPKRSWTNNGGGFGYIAQHYINVSWSYWSALTNSAIEQMNGTWKYWPSWYDQYFYRTTSAPTAIDAAYWIKSANNEFVYIDYGVKALKTTVYTQAIGTYSPGSGGSLYYLGISNSGTSWNNRSTAGGYGVSYTYNAVGSGGLGDRNLSGSVQVNTGVYNYSATKDNSLLSQPCFVSGNSFVISDTNWESKAVTRIEHSDSMNVYYKNYLDGFSAEQKKGFYVRPTYTSVAKTNLKHNYFKQMGIECNLYNGLPLTRTDEDGTVKFQIKFSSTATATPNVSGTFCIRTSPFGNSRDAEPEVDFYYVNEAGIEVSTNTLNTEAKTYDISFKAKKGKIYWVKYIPQTDATTGAYTIVGDILEEIG